MCVVVWGVHELCRGGCIGRGGCIARGGVGGVLGQVLVHCAAGSNRSVAIVVSILMATEAMSLREAFQHVCL